MKPPQKFTEGISDWPSALALRDNVLDLRQSLIRIAKDAQKCTEWAVESWAFLEEPVANLTRELTTNNFENQQCSFETKKFFLKLL
jgi:hypothetical protein